MIQPHKPSRRQFLASTFAAAATTTLLPTAPALAQTVAKPRRQLLGFSKPFQQLSFDQTADVVAEVGWDGIECPVRPGGQIELERAADELPRLVEALGKRGKTLGLLTTAITNTSQPHAESLLRLAAGLGIKRYRLGFLNYAAERPIPVQLAEIQDQLADLAKLNLELGLQAGFQNHSGSTNVGAPAWDIWTLIKDLDPRAIGVCFDIGHATLEGGLSWPTDARLLEPRYSAVFVKDFLWRKHNGRWRADWVPLGQGMVDPRFFTWLKTTSFAGPIVQHHEYDHGQGAPMIAKMRQDLAVLREWLGAA